MKSLCVASQSFWASFVARFWDIGPDTHKSVACQQREDSRVSGGVFYSAFRTDSVGEHSQSCSKSPHIQC